MKKNLIRLNFIPTLVNKQVSFLKQIHWGNPILKFHRIYLLIMNHLKIYIKPMKEVASPKSTSLTSTPATLIKSFDTNPSVPIIMLKPPFKYCISK